MPYCDNCDIPLDPPEVDCPDCDGELCDECCRLYGQDYCDEYFEGY